MEVEGIWRQLQGDHRGGGRCYRAGRVDRGGVPGVRRGEQADRERECEQSTVPAARPPRRQQPGNEEAGGPSGGTPDGEKPDGEKPTGTDPMGGGDKTAEKPAEKPAPGLTNSGADITNLLPNDVQVGAAPPHGRAGEDPAVQQAFFDKANQELIERSLRLKHDDIAEVVHCYVGQDRHPFVVLRTKVDLEEKIVSVPQMDTKRPDGSPIKGKWQFRMFRSNAFVTAVGQLDQLRRTARGAGETRRSRRQEVRGQPVRQPHHAGGRDATPSSGS